MTNKNVFISHNQVRMHDTDMAGRLYFARQFRFAHDALEDFVESQQMNFNYVFHEASFLFVIVHCEADYFELLEVGNKLTSHLSVEHIGTTSFTLFYQFFTQDKKLVGTAKTVHVTLDKVSQKKTPIPDQLRKALEKYQVSA